ncbi:MAG: nucleotidyl transferase AbiEii/AbiGii toxin family protein [Cyanobacteria bacterium P01_H01_bin.121]
MPSLEIPTQLPFLQAICWQIRDVQVLTPLEMLQQYERGWHYQGSLAELSPQEQRFVRNLARYYGSHLMTLFSQPQHQQIMQVLRQLKSDFLQVCKVYFGGGTLLALAYDEYRLSYDLDFLCSDVTGYRQLRQAIFTDQYQALFQDFDQLFLPREIQTNQYGVRFPVVIAGQTIRVEIIAEGRITLDPPTTPDWCPVNCLSAIDQAAEKLLANSDRWSDASVMSRDLIDLAMLRYHGALPAAAFTKAEAAYPVIEPLQRAIESFQAKPDYRQRCYTHLQVKRLNQVIDGLDQLAADFSLAATQRVFQENAEIAH